MAERLLLLRHGEPESLRAGAFLGATDPGLSQTGRDQAGKLASLLATLQPQRCLCSPLKRARQTAELGLAGSGLDLVEESDLREVDFGAWEGLDFQEIVAADPGAVEQWAQWRPDFAFPGGESLGGFCERVAQVAGRLAALPCDTVLVVSHGGVIRQLICHFLGLEAKQYLLFEVAYASLTVIDLFENGKGVLAGLNWKTGS